jgi:hypothetical protein
MKVGISLYVDFQVLNNVETHIEGKNRSEKLEKCIQKGYEIIMSSQAPHADRIGKPI